MKKETLITNSQKIGESSNSKKMKKENKNKPIIYDEASEYEPIDYERHLKNFDRLLKNFKKMREELEKNMK